MRTPFIRLAVGQAEDRCLPSALLPAPGPAIEHHAALPAGSDQPHEATRRDFRADDGRTDWFAGNAERADRVRRESDERPTRAVAGNEWLIGRPVLARTSSTDGAPPQLSAPPHEPAAGHGAGVIWPVALTPVGTGPTLGQNTIVADRAGVSGFAADVRVPRASAGGEDRLTQSGPDDLAGRAPAGCPAGAPDEGATEGNSVRTIAAAIEPMAGLVPFNLADLQDGAGRLLGAVSDLGAAWADGMPAWDQTLWIGAAVLLAAGAAHAAAARSEPQPPGDPRARFRTRQLVPRGW